MLHEEITGRHDFDTHRYSWCYTSCIPRFDPDPKETRMTARHFESIGLGIYSVPEASRLTGIHPRTIRRWISGYAYTVRGHRRTQPPVWEGQFEPIGDELALGFLDLMEIRYVDAFRKSGVPWWIIRTGSTRGKELFHTTHPFCTEKFKTNGRDLFSDIPDEAGKTITIDVVQNHRTFHSILRRYLHGVTFSNSLIAQWWPLGSRRHVVIDPRRSFGKPIVDPEGVPTRVLADAAKAEQDPRKAAQIYEVSLTSMRDAVEYESTLAA